MAVARVALATCFGCNNRSPSGESTGEAGIHSVPARASIAPNALPIPTASIEAAVNPEKLPVYNGPIGSVEGTVFVKGPDAADMPALDFTTCPAAIDTYGKVFRSGRANAQGLRPLADAVVVITGYSDFFLPDRTPSQRITITVDCAYPQRAIAMTYGQRLEVANDSKIPFAPYLEGIIQPAVMIAPPRQSGDPVKLYPPRPGHYVLADRLQPFALEDLYVFRHPLHAVTDLGGHYRIDGVPVGKLKVGALLKVIHSEVDVDVRANVVEKVDVVLSYTPPDAGVQPTGRPPHFIP
ncbi:MAG TPA: hypothetical protein VEK07_08765 [Polyangiaceae bacterium]|nr:hypothetical protein [Polyangiaceae bacterium]